MLQESVERKKATKLHSITLDVHDDHCSPDIAHTDKKKTVAQSQPFHARDKLVELFLGLLILREDFL